MAATLTDKVLIVPAIATIIAKTIAAAAWGLVAGTGGEQPYGEYVLHAGVRAGLGGFSTQQLQWLLPPFVDGYNAWCKKNNITPDIVTIPSAAGNAKGFWVGDKKSAKYHMVWIHGGGWIMPGGAGHLDMVQKIIKWSGNNLAVFCVSYTLSPAGQYPTALSQCVEGLRYVLDQPGRSPSNVLLGGDSAGGNLALSVLGHLIHPHPYKDLVKPLQINGSLYGMMLVSPWISADGVRYKSFETFAQHDSFSISTAKYWGEKYVGPNRDIAGEEYIWPAHADASWWKNSPCDAILATAGEEVCLDPVLDWAKKYGEAVGADKVEMVVAQREGHITPIIAPMTEEQIEEAEKVRKTTEGAMKRWIQKRLV